MRDASPPPNLLLPIIRGVSPESLAPSQCRQAARLGLFAVGWVSFRPHLCGLTWVGFGVFVLVLIGELAKELQGEGYAVRLFLDGVMSSD